MLAFFTDTCGAEGHPEFTIRLNAAFEVVDDATESMVGVLLDYLQSAVAAGQVFRPDQLILYGSTMLRVCERPDRALGIEERLDDDTWVEGVDRSLDHMRCQLLAAEDVGLHEYTDFPPEYSIVQLQRCGLDQPEVTMSRKLNHDPAHSGWYVMCGADHTHSGWTQTDVLEFTRAVPFGIPFLALPTETTVQITPPGPGHPSKVHAHVWRGRDEFLTPESGAVFDAPGGTDDLDAEPSGWAPTVSEIGSGGGDTYRTRGGARRGHPEFTIRFENNPVVPGAEAVLLTFLESALAAGDRFGAGETIGLGWSELRVSERGDGTLGLQEDDPRDGWVERVDLAVRDAWLQKEVAASLELTAEIAFPTRHELAAVTQCVTAGEPTEVVMRRQAGGPGESGWTVSCGEDHGHGVWSYLSLSEVVEAMPFAVQFLALPDGTTVFVRAPEVTGSQRIHAEVSRNGQPIVPAAGSYLAAVNG